MGDETVKALMEEAERLVAEQDERLFDALSALLTRAKEQDDRALAGYVHYQRASAYFDLEDEENMLRSLQEALGLLLLSNSGEWIARAYNLFGVYAKQLGCFDMAYNYFLLAYSYVEKDTQSLSRSIVENNLGDLRADVGDYRRACTYVGKGLKTLRNLPDNARNRTQLVYGTLNLGLFQLSRGDPALAEKTIARGEKLLVKTGAEAGDTVRFWHSLVLAQLLLATGNRDRIPALTEEIIRQIAEKRFFALFAREIRQFGGALLDAKETETAYRLIRTVEQTANDASSVYVRLMIARLRTEYHYVTGDKEAFARAHRERHLLLKEQEKTRRSLSFKSANLMMMNDSVRQERNRILDENAQLSELAKTDALTSLPNRFALNEYMDSAFEKALREQTVFGFGIVDIDAFKQYNDRFGHAAGDECLKTVAGALKEIADEYGFFVSRYGGDEFTMIYENMDHAKIKQIEKEIYARVGVPVSHGYYADIPDGNARQWDYMTTADTLMYKRKRGS